MRNPAFAYVKRKFQALSHLSGCVGPVQTHHKLVFSPGSSCFACFTCGNTFIFPMRKMSSAITSHHAIIFLCFQRPYHKKICFEHVRTTTSAQSGQGL